MTPDQKIAALERRLDAAYAQIHVLRSSIDYARGKVQEACEIAGKGRNNWTDTVFKWLHDVGQRFTQVMQETDTPEVERHAQAFIEKLEDRIKYKYKQMVSALANAIFQTQEQDYPSNVLDFVARWFTYDMLDEFTEQGKNWTAKKKLMVDKANEITKEFEKEL